MQKVLLIFWIFSFFLHSQNPITLAEINIVQKEDPAYQIIRKAQKNRLKNLDKIHHFQSKIYAKTNISILERPDTVRFMGIDLSGMIPNKGIVYLSESVSKLYFQREPQKVKEKMIASKSVGFRSIFSLNRAQQSIFNLYENRLYAEAFSDRYFVSPIANDALFYYDFEFQRVHIRDSNSLFEIKLMPKRKVDAIFYGTIYIEDRDYQIVDAHLTIRKDSQLEYIDSLSLHQQYTLIDSVWFPFAQNAKGFLEGFGVKAIFEGFTRHENIEINAAMPPKIFDNEIFAVEESALKDNIFWEAERKIPLQEEEKTRYINRELSESYYQSEGYLKTLDAQNNRFDVDHVLNNYYEYQNTKYKWALGTTALFDVLNYNPIEGYVFQIFPYFKKWHGSLKNYEQYYGQFRLGTGIFNQISHAGYRLGITKSFDYFLDFYLNAEISSAHLPIHSDDPIAEHLNSIYSLLDKKNERKLFDNQSFKLSAFKEWKVGLHTFLALEYVWKRNSLDNNFSHAWVKGGDFPSNYPYAEPKIYENFAKLHFQISYSPGQLYERIGKERNIQENIYPTFVFNYKAGLGNAASLSYHFLQLHTNYQWATKYLGIFSFVLGGGIFVDRSRMNFIDFKHFNSSLYHFHVRDVVPLFEGQPVNKRHSAAGYFLTLDPWALSTDQSYAEFHFEQDLLGMLWNRIPGIRKLNLKWLWGAKVLSTAPYNAIFVEYYIGFYNIFKFIRIDLASHYYQGKFILPEVRLKLRITD